jgi:uracil phosphoribosyltransferase
MRITVVEHPLVAERLTTMRDQTTGAIAFRAAVDGLAGMLIYEATRTLPQRKVRVTTPLAETDGAVIDGIPLLVPILRAGVGMITAALRLMPDAEIGFLGLARDEATFEPKPYLAKLPERVEGRALYVLDPMLATGGSAVHALKVLAERGASSATYVCMLAAPEGIERLRSVDMDIHVVTSSIDERLNEHAFIVPGLGDAGDRQFGPW